MNDHGSSTSDGCDVDLAPFGLHDGDERWLSLISAAERPLGLGSVGSYEILDEVRRGGQGVVYRARCTRTGRLVALKRLLPGTLNSPSVRVRFDREFDALRALKHPNIVTVLSVDATYDGVMFAMEWIDGAPITTWATDRRGSRGGALEIARMLLTVCDAVQHAHQRGLMHRDLKPSNIFIDAIGAPRVLDFGLAKPTPDLASSAADVTRTDQFVGTVAYASPEQLRGRPDEIDVRSDIYALGVMLYELLTGRRPYATGDSVVAALHAIDAARIPSPRRLNSHVPVDLAAVAMKALAPQRAARYQSADALAGDLRCVLAGKPVSARSYGAWEALLRAARRHRVPAACAAATLVLLTVFGVVAAIFAEHFARQRNAAVQAQVAEGEARQAAEVERRKAEAVREFLEDMLAHADPARAGGRDVTVREVLDAATRTLDATNATEAPLAAATRLVMARTYESLGAADGAEGHYRAALDLCQKAHGEFHGETLTALFSLALFLHSTGRADESRQLVAPAVEHLRTELCDGRVPVGADAETITTVQCILGYGDDAELFYRRRIEFERGRDSERQAAIAADLAMLAGLQSGRGKHAEAERSQLEAIEVLRALHGETHPDVAQARRELGTLLAFAGRDEDAGGAYRDAIAIYESLGSHAIEIARANHELAGAMLRLGRLDEAEPPARAALDRYVEILGADHLDAAECRARLGRVLDRGGAHAEAEQLFRAAIESFRAKLKPGHWRTAALERDLGACLTGLRCFEEAESLLFSALDGASGAPSYRRDERREVIERLVLLYEVWERPIDAAECQALLAVEPP